MSFATRFTTATSPATLGIVSIAMVSQARAVMANATAPDAYKVLALAVMNNPSAYVDRVSLAVVTDPTLAARLDANQMPTDAEISTAVGSILIMLTWRPAPPTPPADTGTVVP